MSAHADDSYRITVRSSPLDSGGHRAVSRALDRSGKSVSMFAEEHGLDPQRVYLWRRRLGKAKATTFQKIVIGPSSASDDNHRGDAPFEIARVSGEVIRLRDLLPDRMLVSHSELCIGDADPQPALPTE